ncbi:MAG: metal ABC transporter solute-binding protein, Zn/Mn family, partial [Nitratireductor sp.]
YKAFEKRFNLSEPLLIAVNPETRPSAAKIRELQSEIVEHSISCIFIEPQFDGKLASLIAGNEKVKIATLDPIGATLKPGNDLYFELLGNLGSSLTGCLK